MEFSEVQVQHNWGTSTYTVDGVQLDSEKGGTCRVQWPDLTTSQEEFVSVQEQGVIQDMGHPYHYSAGKLLIRTSHHGLTVDIPIEKVRVANIQQ